jgi:hypothetical protein
MVEHRIENCPCCGGGCTCTTDPYYATVTFSDCLIAGERVIDVQLDLVDTCSWAGSHTVTGSAGCWSTGSNAVIDVTMIYEEGSDTYHVHIELDVDYGDGCFWDGDVYIDPDPALGDCPEEDSYAITEDTDNFSECGSCGTGQCGSVGPVTVEISSSP